MGDYLRNTRACTLHDFHPELLRAIQDHLEKFPLDEAELAAAQCFETVSVKEKKGLFGRKKETVLTGMLLTPATLVWAAGEVGERMGAFSMKLRDIQVEDYEKSSMYRLMQDTGINVLNLPVGDGHGTVFIGLGPEPAGEAFREALHEGIRKAT